MMEHTVGETVIFIFLKGLCRIKINFNRKQWFLARMNNILRSTSTSAVWH